MLGNQVHESQDWFARFVVAEKRSLAIWEVYGICVIPKRRGLTLGSESFAGSSETSVRSNRNP